MSESLDIFYQRELDYFRQTVEDFSVRFPKIANRLNLSEREAQDPHVERLIQAFAYLNARTRHKLDDSFPELADAMLGILYPHMLSPVPSTSVVRFELQRSQKDQVGGKLLNVGTRLDTERVNGHSCQFKTCYPVWLHPLTPQKIELLSSPLPGPNTGGRQYAAGGLCFQLETWDPQMTFADYALDHVRCYINMPNFEKAAQLLELVLTQTIEVVITAKDPSAVAGVLSADCVQPVGFARSEALLPDHPQSFPGYRLLTEYFVLREKFLFFDIRGITPEILSRLGTQLEITLLLREIPQEMTADVSTETVLTNCTPVINLFNLTADAVALNYRTTEYRIIPDARAEEAHEISTVNSVQLEDDQGNLRKLERFYSVNHGQTSTKTGYWHSTRRPGPQEDGNWNKGTEVWLTLMDPLFSPIRHNRGKLYTELTCFNRDLPEQLGQQRTLAQIRFETNEGTVAAIECLVPPTATWRRHMGRRNLWPLVSQLSLNHLSLAEAGDAAEAVREILALNDVKDSVQTRNMVNGLHSISCESCVQRVNGAIVKGTLISMMLEDENFIGDSAYLFSLVVNRFFGMYTSINSFTKLEATTRRRKSQDKGPWTWPAQTGDRSLV